MLSPKEYGSKRQTADPAIWMSRWRPKGTLIYLLFNYLPSAPPSSGSIFHPSASLPTSGSTSPPTHTLGTSHFITAAHTIVTVHKQYLCLDW
ncbi:hypothetical protein VTJ04DRAFT_8744 [Mycothermus thermophilus]|uniref:uncharacterized protein n=1 Tax=Humicola insolens TaxID=85995 RepID=UPI003742C1B8